MTGSGVVGVCSTFHAVVGAAAGGGDGVKIAKADVALARRRMSRGVGPTPADARDTVLDVNDADDRATLGVAAPPRCASAAARDLWRGVGPTPAEKPPVEINELKVTRLPSEGAALAAMARTRRGVGPTPAESPPDDIHDDAPHDDAPAETTDCILDRGAMMSASLTTGDVERQSGGVSARIFALRGASMSVSSAAALSVANSAAADAGAGASSPVSSDAGLDEINSSEVKTSESATAGVRERLKPEKGSGGAARKLSESSAT